MDNLREILDQARSSIKRIQTLNSRIDFYRAAAERATSSYEAVRVSGTGGRSRVEDNAVKLMDVQSALADELDRSKETLRQAEYLVTRVYGKYYDVLNARYLERMSWADIADKLKYDIRWVHRLHGYALLELGKRVFEEQA